MPARSRSAEALVDTSAAVALCLASHVGHERTMAALAGRRLGLAGHAWFETYSVLTRLPAPVRRPPAVVGRILAENFPASRFLGAGAAAALIAELTRTGVTGGSVYDGLVAAAAREHGLPLATRDRRALRTYELLGVGVEFIE